MPSRRGRPGSSLTGREPAGAITVISLPRPQEQPCLQGGACATGLIREGDGSACGTASCASQASPQPYRWSLCPFYGRGNQRPHSKRVLSWEAAAGCKGCFSSTLKQRVPGPTSRGGQWPAFLLRPTLPGDVWVSRFRDSSSEALRQQRCSGLVKTLARKSKTKCLTSPHQDVHP